MAPKKTTKLKFKGFDWLKFKFNYEITPEMDVLKSIISNSSGSDMAASEATPPK